MPEFHRSRIVRAASGSGRGFARKPADDDICDTLGMHRLASTKSIAKPAAASPRAERSHGADQRAGAAGIGVTCFVGGTMIMTSRGETPVEALRAGDVMLTMLEMPWRRPLLGIGCSRVDLSLESGPNARAPVLIRAGALMKGSPIRDLRVSPGEGILLDGRLVPARLLVNGSTILQEHAADRIAYYYLWLEAHALLIADGTLAESSFEDDWQRDYGDAANVTAFAPPPLPGGGAQYRRCLPLLTEGPELLLIQQRLAQRARGPTPVH